jgi:serine/threonine protein kinase
MTEPTSEQSIFLQAVGMSAPAEREAFLDEACRDKPKLRAEVVALLAAHDRLGSPLPATGAHPAGPEAAAAERPTASPSPEAPGTVIGSYKLLEPIGEGGMGTVWMAQQTEPVRRLVAVKLIKAGMDSRQVIARFEAERQALALMDHANIARVLDAGTTDAGRPYFVMDLVKGVPITRYCDEHHLTPRQRLELLIPVCQAVQHAHQKGIIHRDLKPSNVLVALYDGKPVPKVIDFGVAKAAGQSLTDKTLVTGFGNIVGTLEYMSPEQAEINQLDIDTRSDIYSLGVLLYELLTGSPPFSRKELEKAGMLEMLRVIREQEPSKPSTKLSTAEGLPTLAANRGTEPARLTKLVRGELDWIVMKALEKDRNRRYETANGFAMDVQRYLADEAVLACPPSVGYRLRKFARKHRKTLATAATFVLLLAAATVVSTWQAFRAWHAETKARASQALAEERFELAKEAVHRYLNEVTETPELKNANFERLRKKLLESALPFYQKLVEQAPGDARGEAAKGLAYFRLAVIRAALGEHAAAVRDYEQARDIFARLAEEFPDVPDHRADLAETHSNLGSLRQGIGEPVAAEAAFRAALREQQRLVKEHPNVPDYHERLARSHEGLGNVLGRNQGKWMEAIAEYRAAIQVCQRLVNEHPKVPLYRYQLAISRHHLADASGKEAEPEYRAALREHQRVADEHPDLSQNRFQLALTRHALGNALCQTLGKPAQAEVEYRAALRQHQRVVDEHPNVSGYRLWLARCHHQLGILLAKLGRPADAEAEYRAALKVQEPLEESKFHADVPEYRDILSTNHRTLGDALMQKGDVEGASREYQAAERFAQWEAAVSACSRLLERDASNADARTHRGHAHAALSQWDKAAVDLGPTVESADCSDLWVQVACLRLLLGDAPGYQLLCRRLPQLAKEAAKNPEGDQVYTASRICTLSAAVAVPARQVASWAEQAVAVEKSAWRLHMLARAHYRTGQFEQALRRCRESLNVDPGWPGKILNWLVLAMVHHRLGHAPEAHQWLAKAKEWHNGLARRKDQAAATCPLALYVTDWLEFHVLLPEAQDLVLGPAEKK